MPAWTRRVVLLVGTILLALAACTAGGNDSPTDGTGSDGSTRLAFGLHEQEDGTVVALGVLEWVDLEGGFYALTGAPEGGGTIAVIANPDDFRDELEALVGGAVEVHGTVVEGASIRMAGPEVEIDRIAEITDTPGPAE